MRPIRADTLGDARHSFWTREGGASGGIYRGLNCGLGSGDDRETVRRNRDLVREAMEAEALLSLHQIHSADVVTVTEAWPEDARPKADAMVTKTPGLALGVLVADCAPVLLADPEAGVVGAAHAGWKGALAGVVEATVDAMEALGARRYRTRAAIGPCIAQASYEVGPDFFDAIVADDDRNTRFFAQGQGDRMQFDLPGYVLHRLREAGVAEAEWTRHDTYADEARFFSYRRATHRGERDYGRMIACISV